jgi:uncharacterized membrane protein YfcA
MELMLLSLLLAIVVVGAIMQRITGLGFALVASPFFVLLLDPVMGVILVNVCGIIVSGVLTVRSVRHIDWRRWIILVTSAIIGIVPGAYLVHYLALDWLDIVVGALIIVGLVSSLLVRSRIDPDRVAPLVTAGVFSGAMNVAAGVGGPPLGIYGVLTSWDHRTFAATMQPVFFTIGSLSLIAKLSIGPTPQALYDPNIWFVLAGGCLVGMIAGELIAKRVTNGIARRLLVILALIGAATVLARGVLSLLGVL